MFSLSTVEEQALKWIHNLRDEEDFVEITSIEERLIEMGTEIIDVLISVLDDELDKKTINREFAISVIKVLREIHDPQAVHVLVKATYIVDWIVRQEAVYALTETIDNNASNLDMIISILEANDPYVQSHAKETILDIEPYSLVTESLIKAMQFNRHETAMILIIDILSVIGGDKAADYLFSLLNHSDEKARKEAVLALHKIDAIKNGVDVVVDKDTLLRILDIIKDDITFYEIWNETVKILHVPDLKDIKFLIRALYIGGNAKSDNLKIEAAETINRIGEPALGELNAAIKEAMENSPFYSSLLEIKNKIDNKREIAEKSEIVSAAKLTDRKTQMSKRYETSHLPMIGYIVAFFGISGGIGIVIFWITKSIRFHMLRGKRWRYVNYQPHSASYYKVPSTRVKIRGLHLEYMIGQKNEGCNLCGKFDFNEIGKVVINAKEFLIVQCKEDGLIWRTPLLPVPLLKEFFAKHYYKSPYPEYFGYVNYAKMNDERQYLAKKWLKLINDFRNTNDNYKNRLLDIGCGAGDLLDIASDDGWDARGTEISAYAVKNLIPRLHYRLLHDDRNEIKIYYTTLADFVSKNRIKEEIFDVITAFEVLEIMHDPQTFLETTKKALKPGGHIFVGISAPKGVNQLVRLAENQFHISEEIGIRMIEKAGFKMIASKSISNKTRNHGKILIAKYSHSVSQLN